MKLTCDLCGGSLQMNPGGQGATCTECGLTYSLERLREKLGDSRQVVSPVEEPIKKPSVVSQTGFRMTVEDVFWIAGRGAVVTGTIENSSICVGSQVSINGGKTGKVDAIEINKKYHKLAQAGDSVGLLLKGIKKTDVVMGDVLTSVQETTSEPEDEIIYDVTDWKSVEAAAPVKGFDFVPQQFVMENSGNGIGDLSGFVRQGGIGLGDNIYIDGDYNHPYRVCSINNDPYSICAKEGMPAELFLVKCPRKVWKNARMVTGDPNPVANAYNYPGKVREYFSHLLLGIFGEYEIRSDVPKDGLKIPVHYLFCRGGKPVLAVFLIDSKDSNARYYVEKAARMFALEGVSCTHFYENYRNDAPYVIDRVRGALG